jgi:L-ascorbate metabolism protein UlaG (beta-lactamase superfamily)
MDIRFLGHACFELTDGGTTVLIDPFLTGNPMAAATADEVNPTVIALTHGHADHFGDTVDIAKRTGATVVALTEIASEIGEAGVESVFDPNFGGVVEFDWGWIKLVPAFHTSTTPKGTVTPAGGLLVKMGETLVYHLGDTALFSDLQLISRRGDHVDVALVPIGGHYTMDRVDAVAAVEFVAPTKVIPCHYDTFPPIEADADQFKADVEMSTAAEVVILAPGETHTHSEL